MSKKLQKIVSITTSVATIAWVSGIGMLAPMAASAATINEGDTIRVANTFDVFIAKYVGTKKFKRLILNPEVFNSYGHLSWGAVKTVTQAEMDAFTNSDLVRALGDAPVYKLTPNGDVGTKQWVNMTAEQFVAGGYDWDSIYVINNVDRDNYTAGSDICSGTCPSTTGGALTVALASDTPAAGVAPENASRVPFTKINFTAGANAVTITSLTAQRTGLADDLVLSSVMLIDLTDNSQIGLNQTLNAVHQVTFNNSIVVSANSTKSVMLAANMPASLDSYAGQLASLALTAITSDGSVSGTLPITGNLQTINATLAIGSATVNRGSLDPGTDADKEVGTANYNFTGLKITAGSAEDMTVDSIRFNQSGSAASSDLTNLKVTADGTDYATTVSSDGKYYKASFGSGIVIAKGLAKEFTIKGDIGGGSNRTISFDVYRDTDIVVKGNTYGYYRTADGTSEQTTPTDGQFGSGTPFYNAYDVTVGTGTLRVDKSSTGAPAANITEGATGQLLGAFDFVVKGEAVNVASIVLDLDHTGTGSTSDITSITLTKADGTVLAGPVNGTDETTSHAATLNGTRDGYATFSGTVTFPVGTTQVLVKGNLNTDFAADDTFKVGFDTPDAHVTSITGGTTGNSITAAPTTEVYGNTMTVKAGSLTVSKSGTPVAQTVIRGITGFTFANYIFDASASGEDIRVTSIELEQNVDALANDNAVSGMQLWDGATALNTGTNVKDPDGGATTNIYAFTLDNALIITKGTTKTVALKGNLSGSATAAGWQEWGLSGTDGSEDVSATGVSTGNDIAETVTGADGQRMTVAASGQYSVVLDSSTPAGKLIAGGTTGNIMTVLKFKATAEPITITKIRLSLGNASSTSRDLAGVSLWDGSTKLAEKTGDVFGNAAGQNNSASSTFTLSPGLLIPSNGEKLVTIKGDIGAITTTDTVATAGHQIAINYYDSANADENLGTGMSSGTAITNYSDTTAQTAAFIMRSVPTIVAVSLPTTTLTTGTVAISKFSVSADAKGDVDLYKFTFKIATTSGSTGSLSMDNLTVVDVTSSAETILHASTTNLYTDHNTVVDFLLLASPGTWGTSATTTRTVSASGTRTFELRADVTGVSTGASISTQLEGDAAAPTAMTGGNLMTATAIDSDASNDFIWSDLSDTDHVSNAFGATITDYFNGYLVSGLPSSNLAAQIIAK